MSCHRWNDKLSGARKPLSGWSNSLVLGARGTKSRLQLTIVILELSYPLISIKIVIVKCKFFFVLLQHRVLVYNTGLSSCNATHDEWSSRGFVNTLYYSNWLMRRFKMDHLHFLATYFHPDIEFFIQFNKLIVGYWRQDVWRWPRVSAGYIRHSPCSLSLKTGTH